MFGLLYGLFFGGAYAASKISESIEDSQWKKHAIEEKNAGRNTENLYRDHKGIYRDLFTHQPRVQYVNKYGEACLSDIHGNTVRNLSEEKKNNEWIQRLKESDEGVKAVFYEYWTKVNSRLREDGPICGNVYKDVRTGELYFERTIIWDPVTFKQSNLLNPQAMVSKFYMRISDGTLAGRSDDWEEAYENRYKDTFLKPTEAQAEEFILFFNEKQKNGGWRYYSNDYSGLHIFKQHDLYLYK